MAITTEQSVNSMDPAAFNVVSTVATQVMVAEGETMYYLEQVNSRTIRSFPASSVFEFRITRPGTLGRVIFDARDNLVADCTFDVNLGTRISNVESIFVDPGDRPVIPSGNYTVEAEVAVEVVAGDLVSIDIDSFGGESVRLLAVRLEIETS